MTPVAVALVVAGGSAAANWVAVARERRRVEYVAKPLAMAALVAVALLLPAADETRRAWFVAAGLLSLMGDVFLMLPRDRFVAGLASFLGAHVCYTVGLARLPLSAVGAGVGLLVVSAAVATLGLRVLRTLRAGPHTALLPPVAGYMLVISTMVVVAFATGLPAAVAGAVLFYASDGLIAVRRFLSPPVWAPVAIMVTYHAGQALLVLSLRA